MSGSLISSLITYTKYLSIYVVKSVVKIWFTIETRMSPTLFVRYSRCHCVFCQIIWWCWQRGKPNTECKTKYHDLDFPYIIYTILWKNSLFLSENKWKILRNLSNYFFRCMCVFYFFGVYAFYTQLNKTYSRCKQNNRSNK